MDHAVTHLAHAPVGQGLFELGLTKQHDVQQFVLVRLQVGQQAHFLQGIERHGVGFVNDQQHTLPRCMAAQELVVQGREAGLGGARQVRQPQVPGNSTQNFIAAEAGVGQVNGADIRSQLADHQARQQGFATAHLGHQGHDALFMLGHMQQRRQNVTPASTRKKEAQVRRDLEWGLA